VEARVAEVEASVEHIERDMRDVKVDIRDLRKTMSTQFYFLFSALGVGFVILLGAMLKDRLDRRLN